MKNFTTLMLFCVMSLWCIHPLKANRTVAFFDGNSGFVGDVLHAASGTSVCGVVYNRSGAIYYNQMDAAGVWGAEVLVASAATQARLAIDASNHVHVVYTTANKIGYRMFNGTAWGEEVLIESNYGGSCSKPDVAVDYLGKIHVTYSDMLGDTGGQSDKADIMYATNASGAFVKTLIFRGYYENWGGTMYWGEYFDKGSYITVNSEGSYFILSHKQIFDRSSGGTAYRTYSVDIKSNLGTGSTTGSSSDIFNIYDIDASGDKVIALYAHSGFKVVQWVASGTTINPMVLNSLTTTLVSNIVVDAVHEVVGGVNNSSLYTVFNGFSHTHTGVTVRGTAVPVLKFNDTFYAFYTDNADGVIKYKEVMQPGAIASFSVPQQVGAAKISIQNRSIEIEVPKGSDRSALVATFTTTSDATSVLVNETPQVTGVTANNFEAPVTYKVVTADLENSWTVTVTEAVASSAEITTMTEILLSPNPVVDYLTITYPSSVSQMEFSIYNIQGKQLINKRVLNNQMLSLKELRSGVYFYVLTANGKSQTGKLIKK